jgi:hypothetical protein
LLKVIITLYRESLKAIEAGVELEKIKALKALPSISRARLIPEEEAKEQLLSIEDSIKDEISVLKGGSHA